MLIIQHWLSTQVTGWLSIGEFLIGALLIELCLSILIYRIAPKVGIYIASTEHRLEELDWAFVCIGFPVAEEAIFRLPPVFLISHFSIYFPISLGILFVWSGILFGIYHGSLGNILIQGIFGLILAIVFLKCGGLGGHMAIGFVCALLIHSAHNLICYLSIRLSE